MWSKKRSLVKPINKAGKPVNKCIMSPCHELSVILCIQNENANARCDVFRQFSISRCPTPDAMFFVNFRFRDVQRPMQCFRLFFIFKTPKPALVANLRLFNFSWSRMSESITFRTQCNNRLKSSCEPN